MKTLSILLWLLVASGVVVAAARRMNSRKLFDRSHINTSGNNKGEQTSMTLAKGFQLANHLLLITESLFEDHFQPQQQQESDEASARIYGVGVSTFIRLMSNLALHTIFRKVSIILALPMLASVFLSTTLAVAIGGLSLQPI